MPKADPNRNRKFAELYVHGPPTVRGDWKACAEAAGFGAVPRKTHKGIRQELARLGVAPPAAPPSHFPPSRKRSEPEDASDRIAAVLGEMPEEAGEDWFEWAAEQLKPVWFDIARGTLRATPGQRLTIQNIIDRVHGKAGQQKKEDGRLGVVIIPALGSGADTTVCPTCGHRLKK